MSGDAETLAEAWHEHDDGLMWPDGDCDSCAGTEHHRRHYVIANGMLAAHDAAIRAEALEDAAQYAEEIDALGRTPSIQFTDAQRQTWRDSHLGPLVPVGLSYRPRQIIAEWLRARAAALRAAQPAEGES